MLQTPFESTIKPCSTHNCRSRSDRGSHSECGIPSLQATSTHESHNRNSLVLAWVALQLCKTSGTQQVRSAGQCSPSILPFSSGAAFVGPQSISIHSARKYVALSCVRLLTKLAHTQSTHLLRVLRTARINSFNLFPWYLQNAGQGNLPNT
jgi:hypothetical protein